MSNNIFRNFSWGNNIPKIFVLFISLSVFGGGGEFMSVSLPLFLFYCFGFLYPKINKLFGGCMCVIVSKS